MVELGSEEPLVHDEATLDDVDTDGEESESEDEPRPSKLRAVPSLSNPSKPASFGQPMASHLDFRYLDEGLGGERGKRKRREAEAEAADSMDLDADTPRPSKLRAVPSLSDPSKPASFGQPTYDGIIAGRVSGRRWKEPRTRRASALVASRKPTPLEQRAREKTLKRAYQTRVAELKEEIRQNKVAKRKQREEREKRKKENVLRTGTKLQRVTNPKTIQKIAKSKKRKQLKVVPDELLGGRKSETNRRMQVPGLDN